MIVATYKHSRRNQNEIRSSFQRLTMCQQAVSYTGPHSWNRLPEALKQIKTIGRGNAVSRFFLLSSIIFFQDDFECIEIQTFFLIFR